MQSRALSVNPHPAKGGCRLLVDGVPCPSNIHGRGLCKHHYDQSRRRPELKALLLPPVRGKENVRKRLAVVPRPRKGCCRVAADGVPCQKPASGRGLCVNHYTSLRHYGLLDVFGLPATKRHTYEVNPKPVPGCCRVLVNGRPCLRKVKWQSVCHTHHDAARLRGMVLPRTRPHDKMQKSTRRDSGRCCINEDGLPCTRPAWYRGLCSPHYAAARKSPQGLDYWALPPERLRRGQAKKPHAGS